MGIFLTEQWGWYCLAVGNYCMLGACKTIAVWLGFVVLVTLLLLCLAGWHGSSLRSNWIDNKGKGVLIISSIHTAHILSEFNYREVKWKWNTKLLQESGKVNVLDCS